MVLNFYTFLCYAIVFTLEPQIRGETPLSEWTVYDDTQTLVSKASETSPYDRVFCSFVCLFIFSFDKSRRNLGQSCLSNYSFRNLCEFLLNTKPSNL